jgi:hypothetical protein
MMCRWISEVPSQIRSARASRHSRSIGNSFDRPMPPKICTPWSATVHTISEAWRFTIEASSALSVP